MRSQHKLKVAQEEKLACTFRPDIRRTQKENDRVGDKSFKHTDTMRATSGKRRALSARDSSLGSRS